jgi:hypothetical protein
MLLDIRLRTGDRTSGGGDEDVWLRRLLWPSVGGQRATGNEKGHLQRSSQYQHWDFQSRRPSRDPCRNCPDFVDDARLGNYSG